MTTFIVERDWNTVVASFADLKKSGEQWRILAHNALMSGAWHCAKHGDDSRVQVILDEMSSFLEGTVRNTGNGLMAKWLQNHSVLRYSPQEKKMKVNKKLLAEAQKDLDAYATYLEGCKPYYDLVKPNVFSGFDDLAKLWAIVQGSSRYEIKDGATYDNKEERFLDEDEAAKVHVDLHDDIKAFAVKMTKKSKRQGEFVEKLKDALAA